MIDMSIKLINTAIVAFVLALTACDGGKPADKDANKAPTAKAPEQPTKPSETIELALDPKVEQAVTLANKISAQPESADSILAEAGMDRESFEKLLYEIARDPELSKSYAVAREA